MYRLRAAFAEADVSVAAGTVVDVVEQDSAKGWTKAAWPAGDWQHSAWLPAAYLEPVNQNAARRRAAPAPPPTAAPANSQHPLDDGDGLYFVALDRPARAKAQKGRGSPPKPARGHATRPEGPPPPLPPAASTAPAAPAEPASPADSLGAADPGVYEAVLPRRRHNGDAPPGRPRAALCNSYAEPVPLAAQQRFEERNGGYSYAVPDTTLAPQPPVDTGEYSYAAPCDGHAPTQPAPPLPARKGSTDEGAAKSEPSSPPPPLPSRQSSRQSSVRSEGSAAALSPQPSLRGPDHGPQLPPRQYSMKGETPEDGGSGDAEPAPGPTVLLSPSRSRKTAAPPTYEAFYGTLGEAEKIDLQCIQSQCDSWAAADGWCSTLQLVYCGRMTKISRGKQQAREFYLFDHLLVYGRRERKRFNIRASLSTCNLTIRGVEDGVSVFNEEHLDNAMEMHIPSKDKWVVVYCETPEEKDSWLKAMRSERACSKVVNATLRKLGAFKHMSRGIGFEASDIIPGRSAGCRVNHITDQSLCPGLKVGDRLWQIAGEVIKDLNLDGFLGILNRVAPNTNIDVVVQRL